MANQGTSRPVPLHLQPFRTRWDHGHVSEVDGIIRIAPICSTQWLSIFCLHWSWFSPTASKLQISNIISRHASGMPLSKIPWKQCVYSISYLTYLFALTEMHFLIQKLEHAWLRKFSCWVVVALQKEKRKRYQRVPWTGQCEDILHSQMWVIRRQTPSNTCPGLHLLPWVENDHAVGLRLHNALYGCNWVVLFPLFFIPQFITIR